MLKARGRRLHKTFPSKGKKGGNMHDLKPSHCFETMRRFLPGIDAPKEVSEGRHNQRGGGGGKWEEGRTRRDVFPGRGRMFRIERKGEEKRI